MKAITACLRCGKLGLAGEGSPTARPFRKARKGLCTACVVCAFFQEEEDGIGFALPPDFDPEGLKLPHLQAQFARVLAVGRSELSAAEIDWDEVIQKWNLPAPTARKEPRPKPDAKQKGKG